MKKLWLIAVIAAVAIFVAAPVTGNETDTRVTDVVDISNHWAETQMTHLVAMGVVKGYSTTTYDPGSGTNIPTRELRPQQRITRAEFAVMMYETLNLTPVSQKAPFIDADQIPAWAAKAIDTLYSEGIMLGSNGRVKPNAYITRAEIAAMVVQGVHDKSEVVNPKFFPDVPENHWASKPVQKAADMGIIQGKTNGTFAPASFATRGEVMTMLYNMLSFDRQSVPGDKALLELAKEYMNKNAEIISGGAPYDLSPLKSLVTGHEAAAIGLNTEILNQMASQYQEIKYEVLSEGQVVNKSDWLAEVVFDTRMTLQDEEAEEIIMDLKEHVYLMKIGQKWLVYYVPSDKR